MPMPLTFPLVEVKSEPAHSFRVRHFCIIGPSSRTWKSASGHLGRTLNERIAKDLKNRQEATLACLGFLERQVLSKIVGTAALHGKDLDERSAQGT